MSLEALRQNVQIATEALELECLLAGYNDAAPEVVAAQAALSSAAQQLIRAEAIAKQERDHAETCRIAAAMAQAPTETEALEILRKANAVIADQQADAQHHRDAAADPTDHMGGPFTINARTMAGTWMPVLGALLVCGEKHYGVEWGDSAQAARAAMIAHPDMDPADLQVVNDATGATFSVADLIAQADAEIDALEAAQDDADWERGQAQVRRAETGADYAGLPDEDGRHRYEPESWSEPAQPVSSQEALQ